MKLRTHDEATSRLAAYQNEVAVLEKRAKEAESALAVAKTERETLFQAWKRATARLEADLDKAVAERDAARAKLAESERRWSVTHDAFKDLEAKLAIALKRIAELEAK